MAVLTKLGNYKNFALLIMRAGLGVMMVMHGYPKLLGGIEKWEKLGTVVTHLGIDFAPAVFWGFMAAFSECIGGALLALGLLFRPMALLLMITMIFATIKHMSGGDSIMDASHAIELGFVFLGLFILGPGKYSFDKA